MLWELWSEVWHTVWKRGVVSHQGGLSSGLAPDLKVHTVYSNWNGIWLIIIYFTTAVSHWDFSHGEYRLLSLGKASCNSHTTQPTLHAGCSSVSVIHQIPSSVSVIHQTRSSVSVIHQTPPSVSVIHQTRSTVSVIHQTPSSVSVVHQTHSSVSVIHQTRSSVSVIHQTPSSVSVIHQTLTWALGSSTCICDLLCVHIHKGRPQFMVSFTGFLWGIECTEFWLCGKSPRVNKQNLAWNSHPSMRWPCSIVCNHSFP